jgi:hypothetical protein
MKKNNIIVEVDRIKEMMSLTILNEGIPDPLIKGMMKIIDDFALTNKGSLTKNFDPALKRVQSAFNSGDIVQFKKSMYRLIDMDDELYDLVKSDIFKQNQKLIDSINKSIEDSLSRKPPLTKDEIRTKLNDYWRDQIFPNYPSRKFRDELMEKFNKKIDNYIKPLPSKVSTDTFAGKAKAWISSLTGADLQSIRRIFFRWSKTYQELSDEFFKYADEAEAIMRRKPPGNASYQFKKMADILASMKKSSEVSGEVMWNGLSEKGQKGFKDMVSTDVASKLESSKKPWSDIFQAAIKGDTELKGRWELLSETIRVKKFGWKRFFNFIKYGDFRHIDEIREFIAQKGVTEYVLRRAMTYFLVMPFLETLYMTGIYALGKTIENVAGEETLGNITGYAEVEDWDETFFREFKNNFLEEMSVRGFGQFIIPSFVDEIFQWFVFEFMAGKAFSGISEPDLQELESKKVQIWNGFDKETQDIMRDAAEETGDEDLIALTEKGESNTTVETPITNPIEKEIRDNFPCAKKYPLKVISNTNVEFTNVSSGNEIILAEKINGVWTWTDTGLPLKCNK